MHERVTHNILNAQVRSQLILHIKRPKTDFSPTYIIYIYVAKMLNLH